MLVESEEEEFEIDGDEYNGYYTQDQMREKFRYSGYGKYSNVTE